MPNGARRSSSSASVEPERVARHDRVDALGGHEVVAAQRAPRRAPANAARKPSSALAPRSPARRRRGGRRGAPGARAQASQAAEQVEGGDASAPSPVPRSPSSAMSTAGRWWRSAMREATIPITPGVPALAGEHVAPALLAALARPAPRRRTGCAARRARRSALAASSSSAIARRALGVLGEHELEPGVGAVQAPGGVDARREAEADRVGVERARVDARDRHQRAQARACAVAASARRPSRTRRRFSPRSGTQSATVASADEVEVAVGGASSPAAAPERLGQLVARRRRRTGRGTGSRPSAGMHDRRVGQRAVGARGCGGR